MKTKKIMTLVIACLMALSLTGTAFAADHVWKTTYSEHDYCYENKEVADLDYQE